MIHDSLTTWPVEPGSVDIIVTSPPYWGLRSYGDSARDFGQWSQDDYEHATRAWLDHADIALSERGTMWVVIGDTYAGSGGAGGDYKKGGKRDGYRRFRQGKTTTPPQSLCLVPWKLADIAINWYDFKLRSVVIWDKVKKERQAARHIRRPINHHEYVLMFTKSMDYEWNGDQETTGIWTIPAQRPRYAKKHEAPFPEELVRKCLLLSGSPLTNPLVCDPFAGSGTVERVCTDLGMRYVGWDIHD